MAVIVITNRKILYHNNRENIAINDIIVISHRPDTAQYERHTNKPPSLVKSVMLLGFPSPTVFLACTVTFIGVSGAVRMEWW